MHQDFRNGNARPHLLVKIDEKTTVCLNQNSPAILHFLAEVRGPPVGTSLFFLQSLPLLHCLHYNSVTLDIEGAFKFLFENNQV